MLSDRTAMFINVEQETAITVLRPRELGVVDAHTRVSVLKPDGEFEDVGEYLLPSCGAHGQFPGGQVTPSCSSPQDWLDSTFQTMATSLALGTLWRIAMTVPDMRRCPPPAQRACRPIGVGHRHHTDGRFEHGRDSA